MANYWFWFFLPGPTGLMSKTHFHSINSEDIDPMFGTRVFNIFVFWYSEISQNKIWVLDINPRLETIGSSESLPVPTRWKTKNFMKANFYGILWHLMAFN